MTKIVSLYNNKGGVAKTTTLFNTAVFLAKEKNKKVLLVDCDPQCNATELFFCSADDFDEPDNVLPGTSIYDALRPRFAGDAARVDVSQIKLAPSPIYPNLQILRGDINFSRAEQYFSAAITQAVTESIHEKNTYAVMSRMLRDIGKLHGFDYILCDVGPSAGSITRMTILSCDGVFIPIAPDRFSHQAIQGMGAIMDEWLTRHQLILSTFEPYGINVPLTEPKFFGAIINIYKIHRAGKKKGSYIKWEQLIEESIKGALLSGVGKKLLPSKLDLLGNPFVASIRDVGPMAPVAQIVGKAIFDVSQQDTAYASSNGDYYRGFVWEDWQARMEEYKSEIAKIALAME
jgi:cellulose biosynthesis protein BcsQ